jgi:hypothetical protein
VSPCASQCDEAATPRAAVEDQGGALEQPFDPVEIGAIGLRVLSDVRERAIARNGDVGRGG